MEAIKGSINYHNHKRPSAVGLGNFDGLHKGHMELIGRLISESSGEGLNSVVYTFASHTENILRKKLFKPLLTTIDQKIRMLSETRLDFLCYDEFDEKFSRMRPDEFVRDILVERFEIKLAVVGFNYRFGYRGAGNADLLVSLGGRFGFRVIIMPPVKYGDKVISSTLIRGYIAGGEVEKVLPMLGRYYTLRGTVDSGRKLGGGSIGFPTANIYPQEHLALPAGGVYITKTLIDGASLPSVTNIGFNPTVSDAGRYAVETHILDFNGNLYGKTIEVEFIRKIRDEIKFGSINELASGINNDITETRAYFNGCGVHCQFNNDRSGGNA
ncbi:MAG: bifunctional riboflavin kinase/FAD synthetase [Eubacteriales bacterium]|nr:bifunctional riboflavin kinase/FAD synthetase [Eubacteriales bacterium]